MFGTLRTLLIFWTSVILIAYVATCFAAQSQVPPPTAAIADQHKKSESTETKESPAKDLRGTNEKPLIVDILPSTNAEEIAKRKHEQEEQKSTLDWWLTGASVALAVITFFLALYTARLWSATNQSAETLPKLERAYVFAKVEAVGSITTTFEGTTAPMARTLFVNHGKTPAIIINMSGSPYVMNMAPQQLAKTPDDDRRLPEGWVIASAEPFLRPIQIGLTDPQVKAIHDGTLKLYCAGLIRYKDILGDERETGYCWEYQPVYGRFQFCKESNLNHYN